MSMPRSRYEELLGRLFDGELSEEELAELEQALKADGELAEDLREHLVLWDLWSQEQTAGRDTAAFLRSFQTRLEAEAETDSFAAATVRRIATETSPQRRTFWPLALAASLAVAAVIGWWWILQPRHQASLVTQPKTVEPPRMTEPAPALDEAPLIKVRGELVCAKCALHRADVHVAAIRLENSPGDDVLFISNETANRDLHGETFCAKPESVVAEGRVREMNHRRELLATRLEILRR